METSVVVVGAGPAGMMTALLLARQGIDVLAVEKHADFHRDFRGDTIHPSTLQLMQELGWLPEFLRLRHTKLSRVTVQLGESEVTFADFSKLPVAAPYVAFVPQWDFLDFLARKAETLPHFRLVRSAAVEDVMWERGRAVGVRLSHAGRTEEIRAEVVIGADGRHSTVREAAGLPVRRSAPPIDVFWFRLPRSPGQQVPFFRGGNGALVSIDRGDYWQVAYTVPVDASPEISRAGIAAFRARVAALEPDFAGAVATIRSLDEVHLLSVRVDRLRHWRRPGLLCIGDAAHAMSPAGGVGINLAIQDGVATANLLGAALVRRTSVDRALARIQRRRDLPARITQLYQLRVLKGLYPKSVDDDTTRHLPLIFRLFRRLALLRHVGGRFIGLGIRPEHVQDNVAKQDEHKGSGPKAQPGAASRGS